METERERLRRLYPEFYKAAAFFHPDTVSSSITDADGEVVMSYNPDPDEYKHCWLDGPKLMETNRLLDEHYAYAAAHPAPKSWVKRTAVIKNGGLS